MATYLCIKPNKDVSPVPVEAGYPDFQVRLWLFEAVSVRGRIGGWGYEARFGLTVYLSLFLERIQVGDSVRCRCRGGAEVGYGRIGGVWGRRPRRYTIEAIKASRIRG